MIATRRTPQAYPSKEVSAKLPITGFWGWILLLIMHVPLALVMHKTPFVATMHAYATLLFVIIVAVRKCEPVTVLLVAFYVLGSEILWRMCGATVPWETGKYAVVLLCGLGALRTPASRPFWPLLYFLLLIPSALGVLFDYSLDEAKRLISFNLSGPLALAVCLWFSANRKLSVKDLTPLLHMALVPLAGVLAITLFSTYSQQLVFTTEANFTASGGFGPNQVSAILGLGAVFCFCLLVVDRSNNMLSRLMLMSLMIVFLAQATMTFSRTGVYLAGSFMLVSGLMLLQTPRSRFYMLVTVAILGVLGTYVLFPKLDAYTGGKLATRYAETHTTGRSEIMLAEVELFLKNPILGVGPGGAKTERNVFSGYASHSEPSRLLAEHGVFGLLAQLLLIVQMFKALVRPSPAVAKACTYGATVWTIGFMLASAMRLVAPVLVLALVFVNWHETPERSVVGNVNPSR